MTTSPNDTRTPMIEVTIAGPEEGGYIASLKYVTPVHLRLMAQGLRSVPSREAEHLAKTFEYYVEVIEGFTAKNRNANDATPNP